MENTWLAAADLFSSTAVLLVVHYPAHNPRLGLATMNCRLWPKTDRSDYLGIVVDRPEPAESPHFAVGCLHHLANTRCSSAAFEQFAMTIVSCLGSLPVPKHFPPEKVVLQRRDWRKKSTWFSFIYWEKYGKKKDLDWLYRWYHSFKERTFFVFRLIINHYAKTCRKIVSRSRYVRQQHGIFNLFGPVGICPLLIAWKQTAHVIRWNTYSYHAFEFHTKDW